MKAFILLGLIVLACSYSGFLRELQTDQPAPPAPSDQPAPAPADNATATNATEPAANVTAANATEANATEANATEANATEANATNETQKYNVDMSGTWTLSTTNCTIAQTSGTCASTVTVTRNPTNESEYTFVIQFPNDPNCGSSAGTSLTAIENVVMGVFMDRNPTSPLYKTIGVFRPNNNTELIMHADVNNVNGGMCWEEWTNSNLSQAIAGNIPTPTTGAWEGAWRMTSTTPVYQGASCCAPDLPVLVHEYPTTSSIMYSWRIPNCPTCATVGTSNMVIFSTVEVVGGVAVDNTTYTYPLVMYVTQTDRAIVVGPDCAIEFTRETSSTCPETQVQAGEAAAGNATNTTAENAAGNEAGPNTTEGTTPTGGSGGA